MIVTLLLTCFILLLVHYYIVRFERKGRLVDRIPGYTVIPLIGNIYKGFGCSPEQLWTLRLETMAKFYPITKFWALLNPNVVTCHPDDAEKMLNSTKHTVKGNTYKYLHPWLGDGLLTSNGKKWQDRRKILTPAFHFSILKQFVDILIEEGNRAMESFDHTKETIIENVMFFTSHHTLSAICETSMGISLNDIGSFQQEYRQTVHDMGYVLVKRFFKPWLIIDIFKLSPLCRMQTKCLNILHSFTEKIIAERKKYHERTGGRYLMNFTDGAERENAQISGTKMRRMAMLDILIAESHKSGLSDRDIREEVDTFVFEGHDTVAIASCFSLLLLAEHKEIQERARKEINEVMQEYDGKLTMNALQKLSYLERCLKEALRLYPSVYHISRTCTEDVYLQSYLVPAGVTVHLIIYDLHRDPNFWPNPEIFDPDRFLPENIQKRHPYSYIPFSAGPRNCIGQRFAMLELKALIAPLIYNFYLEPIDYLKDAMLKVDLVLRTSRPMRMKIIPINRE